MYNSGSNSLHTVDNEELELIRYREYLLGYNVPGMGRLSSKLPSGRLPLLATPFRRHLNSVNRFLFSGGVTIDVNNAVSKDPRQEWLKLMSRKVQLDTLLDSLWEKGAITGELFISIIQNADRYGNATEYFDYGVYDKTEFDADYDSYGNLLEATVTTVRQMDYENRGEIDVVFKSKYTPEAYLVWPPVPLEKAKINDFGEPEEQPHPYGFVPGVVIKNTHNGTRGSEGVSEFDVASIELATEIAILMVDAAENLHYFGSQLVVTPDVKGTLKALAARSRVLQSLPDADGGKPETLDMKPMPQGHAEYVAQLNENLADHLGSPIVTDRVAGDTSSLTLRLLNAPIIDTAEKKWSAYVSSGVEELLALSLQMAAFEGILGNVNPMDPETYSISMSRKQPYFAPTPGEKQQSLSVVQSLVEIGIRPEVALEMEYFTNYSEEQIVQMLKGDF